MASQIETASDALALLYKTGTLQETKGNNNDDQSRDNDKGSKQNGRSSLDNDQSRKSYAGILKQEEDDRANGNNASNDTKVSPGLTDSRILTLSTAGIAPQQDVAKDLLNSTRSQSQSQSQSQQTQFQQHAQQYGVEQNDERRDSQQDDNEQNKNQRSRSQQDEYPYFDKIDKNRLDKEAVQRMANGILKAADKNLLTNGILKQNGENVNGVSSDSPNGHRVSFDMTGTADQQEETNAEQQDMGAAEQQQQQQQIDEEQQKNYQEHLEQQNGPNGGNNDSYYDNATAQDFTESVLRQARNDAFSDFTIACNGLEHKVNSLVISSLSRAFEEVILAAKDANESRVELKDDPPVAVKTMIDFFKTLDYKIFNMSRFEAAQHHVAVYLLGEKYDIPGLRDLAVYRFERPFSDYGYSKDVLLRMLPDLTQHVYANTPEKCALRVALLRIWANALRPRNFDRVDFEPLIDQFPAFGADIIHVLASHAANQYE